MRDRGRTRVPTDCGSQKHIFFGSLISTSRLKSRRWRVGMSTAEFTGNHQSLVLQRTEFEVIGELEPEDSSSTEARRRVRVYV